MAQENGEMSLDRWFLRQDVIDQLLAQGGDTPDAAASYADHIIELAHIDQAEYQSLKDPFDRSVAIVFELVRSEDMNPWSIDLEHFVQVFSERIRKDGNTIDLPSCGRLIRLAWGVLRHQAEDLYDRMLSSGDDEIDYLPIDGWEMEYDDAGFAFTSNVIAGDVDSSLSGLFQERVRRDEGRPVTLGELLGALREACVEAEEFRLREDNRVKHAAAVKEAISSVGSKMHDENLESDLRLCWNALRDEVESSGKSAKSPMPMQAIQNRVSAALAQEYAAQSVTVPDDIDEQAWITTLVSSLHLTYIGAVEIWQEDVPDGTIHIRDMHISLKTFEAVIALCQKQKDAMALKMEQQAGGKERYGVLMEELAARAAAAKAAEEAAAAELADATDNIDINHPESVAAPEIIIELSEEISVEVVE
ncbi:MAG TPA: hypothetical protein EYN46_00235 [Candidatus Poseidoniales archaeon]|nr:hypothetical protein [Candidatus Poseidoniales archaeon]HIO93782.1 hypothetical protein [Candidatus Poseidoniales archaeon]